QCWAVGDYDNGSTYQTLIEQWNGTSWAIVPSPNTSATQRNTLVSVTCTSASQCWAVGDYDNGSTYQTLIEQWNGTSWAIASSPNTSATRDNRLNGVTCASASQCWAVGDYDNGSAYQTLIEQWNGNSWSIVTSPNTSATQRNYLLGVTCASASQCWAVGSYQNGSTYQTLIEQWSGTSWSIVSSPNTSATRDNRLYGVTCASASQCWAIGDTGSSYQSLIEEYSLTIPPLTSVASRMTHGSVGTFDINLPLTGTPGVECRIGAGGVNGNYSIVFSFTNDLIGVGSASVTSGTGSVSTSALGPNVNQYTVNLTGVFNQQHITISLNNVLDSQNNTGTVIGTMGVLIGDTTGNGTVNSSDNGQVKANSGQTTSASNFRTDVTVHGVIDSSDIGMVKAQSGTSLP
ncbi:MAG: hypothetical protein ACR2NX_04730, partial [Chthoniobacterales bacterium]